MQIRRRPVLTLSTRGTTTNVGGWVPRFGLPAGVTVKLIQRGDVGPESVVTTSRSSRSGRRFFPCCCRYGHNPRARSEHRPFSSNALNGFGAGEFATVHCAIK